MSNHVNTPLHKAHRLLSPRIAYLITTVDTKGNTNVAPISNLTSVSTQPQAIVISVYPQWTTFKNIKYVGQFGVNLGGKELLSKLWICGNKYAGISLPSNPNKFLLTGLTEMPSTHILPPRIAECYAHLECEVEWIQTAGNHMLVYAKVVAASQKEDAFSKDGVVLNSLQYKPLMQITGSHFTVPAENISVDDEDVNSILHIGLQNK